MLGQSTDKKRFRGNLNFASPDHIIKKRASRIDDLYSLVCVAYRYVVGILPWEEHLKLKFEKNGEDSIFSAKKVTTIRIKKMRRFENELIRKAGQLSKLFEYIRKLQVTRNRLDQHHKKAKTRGNDNNCVDYELLISLIPDKKFNKGLFSDLVMEEKKENSPSTFSQIGLS